jgi:hypothetical protein
MSDASKTLISESVNGIPEGGRRLAGLDQLEGSTPPARHPRRSGLRRGDLADPGGGASSSPGSTSRSSRWSSTSSSPLGPRRGNHWHRRPTGNGPGRGSRGRRGRRGSRRPARSRSGSSIRQLTWRMADHAIRLLMIRQADPDDEPIKHSKIKFDFIMMIDTSFRCW